LPIRQWYEDIDEKTVADAILVRIVHDAHRVKHMGESHQKTKGRNVQEIDLE
jgi:hypothetical protein